MVFYGWWMILAMGMISMIHTGIWYYGLSAFIIPLTEEFKWTRMEISLGVSLNKLESGIDGPIIGWMSDRIGPRLTSIFILILSGILVIALRFINSLWSFYALTLIIFFLPTSPATAMGTAVARWFDRKAGMAMGLYSAGTGLSGLISPLLVWLIINYGWRTAFTVAGAIILGVCLPLSFVIKTHVPEHYGLLPDGEAPEKKQIAQKETLKEEGKDFTLREALKDRSWWLVSIAFAISNFGVQGITLHLLPHLINIGFEPMLAALGMTVVTTSSIIGRLMFGWLGDIFEKRYIMALCFAEILVGCLVFARVTMPWAIFLALALFGPGMGGVIVSRMAINREYYGRRSWGKSQGFMFLVSSVPTFLGPNYLAWMYDIYGSYVPAFMPLILLWIVAILLILMARPPQQH